MLVLQWRALAIPRGMIHERHAALLTGCSNRSQYFPVSFTPLTNRDWLHHQPLVNRMNKTFETMIRDHFIASWQQCSVSFRDEIIDNYGDVQKIPLDKLSEAMDEIEKYIQKTNTQKANRLYIHGDYWVIRDHKNNWYLPQVTNKPPTHQEPVPLHTQPPRLFRSEKAAKVALHHWLQGKYVVDKDDGWFTVYNAPNRRAADMEVINFHLVAGDQNQC